jgi:hypothetical protein
MHIINTNEEKIYMKIRKLIMCFLVLVITLLSIYPVNVSAFGSFDTAEEIALSKITVGTLLTKEDVSYYKFTTTDNDSFYKIELRNSEVTDTIAFFLYSDSDLTTEVYNVYANIASIGQDTRKLERNHTYYIAVKNAYSHIGNATGNFKLNVTEIKDDVSDDFKNSKYIPLNKKFTYNLNAKNDIDYFKFKTSSNDSFYNIELSNSGATDNIGMYLYSEADLTSGISDVTAYVAKAASIKQKLKPNTTYYIIVQRPSDWYAPIGTYKININEIKDDASDSFKKSKALSVNKKSTYKINVTGDIDYFKFKPTKSGIYSITFANKNCDGYIDAVIFSEDDITQNIGLIQSNKMSKNTSTYKLKANHTYYISVNAGYFYSNISGEYSLTIKLNK